MKARILDITIAQCRAFCYISVCLRRDHIPACLNPVKRSVLPRKLFITFLLVTALLAGEWVHAQTITLSKKNATLESIFFEVSKQTGFNFFYSEAQMREAGKVTIDVRNATLKEVLEICFRAQPFGYSIEDSSVILKSKEIPQNTVVSSSVRGKVTDINGLPLPGANIKVKGISNGVVADIDGSFELKDVNPKAILEISHVGYETKEIRPTSTNNVLIRLETGTKVLEEVVTNGYRTTTRRDELGSSKRITAEQIAQQPVNNPLAAMQARVPGMVVTQRGGLPGTPFSIQIRGQRSIGDQPTIPPPNSPLFIVDGVPFLNSSQSLTQRSRIVANSPFNTINPADIESIEILKDANATSIYGSLGANGVVLITTKRAKSRETNITADFYTGFTKITRAPDYMNTRQYVEMRTEAIHNDGESINPGNAPDLTFWGTTRYTNWKKLLIGGTGRVMNAHVSLSGGLKYTQFTVSLGYNKETTVFPTDHGKTLTSASVTINHKTENSKFDFSLVSSYGNDKTNLISGDPTAFINSLPNAPGPYDSLGHLVFRDRTLPFNNPFSYFFQPYTFIMERLTTGIRMNYKITTWLNLRTNAGYTFITGDETLQIPISSQDPALSQGGVASFANSKNKNWIIEPQLEFSKKVGRGQLKAMTGISFREQVDKRSAVDGTGYTSDVYLNSIAGAATVKSFSFYEQYRISSLYGLINYSLNRKYLLEATVRRDGSSRFGPNKQFANFGSVAAGWIFSDEKFMQDKLPFLSHGKIRVSYGTTGNDQINDYRYLDTWTGTGVFPYQNPAIRPLRPANNDYRWELQKSLDLGLDLGFCENKITVSATWNQSRTSDQIISRTLPAQTGFVSIVENYPAVVQNQSLEFELTITKTFSSKLNWNSSLNLTIPRNKLLKFPNIESTVYGKNLLVVGQPLYLAWGYRTAGLDTSTGVYQILDKNGKPINFPSLPTADDLVNLGTYDRNYFGGFQNTINLGQWQLYFLLQYVKEKGPQSVYASSIPPGSIANQPVYVLNRWQQAGNQAPYQKYTQNPSSAAFRAGTDIANSDLAFTDASYIRLKNIGLAYDLKIKQKDSRNIRSEYRFYIQCQNILTFTKYKGFDPETNINRQGLPPLKIFTAGFQLSL